MGIHLPVSRSIGQPPANDTTKGTFGAIFIIDTFTPQECVNYFKHAGYV